MERVIDRGLTVGPRLYFAGPYISQTSGHPGLRLRAQPNHQRSGITFSHLESFNTTRLAVGVPEVINTTHEALSEVSADITITADGVVWSEKEHLQTTQYRPQELCAAVESEEQFDTYVAVHDYQDKDIKRALELRVKSIEHGQFINEEITMLLKGHQAFISSNLASSSGGILSDPIHGNPKTHTE